MLSFIEMQLLNDRHEKQMKKIRKEKTEQERYRLRYERRERRQAREKKRDAKVMPEHLRRVTWHIKKEILHDIKVGCLTLDHDTRIGNGTVYTEHRWFLGILVATKEEPNFSNIPMYKPSWGYNRRIKSVSSLAFYYKIKTRDLMRQILKDIGEDIGLKITLGDYTTENTTYVHIEIRNE